MFQRSIAFIEHKFGLHHEAIPASLLDIAEAFRQMGRGCDERLPLLDRAVAILDLSIGREKDRNEAALAEALATAALCCEEAGHLAGAESRWAKSVAAATKVRGEVVPVFVIPPFLLFLIMSFVFCPSLNLPVSRLCSHLSLLRRPSAPTAQTPSRPLPLSRQ